MRAVLILLLLASGALAEEDDFPGEEIWGVGSADKKRLGIILVPDGFTRDDLGERPPTRHTVRASRYTTNTTTTSYPSWPEMCRRLRDGFLQKEPFKTYRNMLRITRIDVRSPNSGISRQSTRTNVDTYFDAEYYDLFDKPDRALRFKDEAAGMQSLRMVKVRGKRIPRHVGVVLVNDPGVIGTGTAFGVNETGMASFIQTPSHPHAISTFTHEMGHALARLGDEYFEDLSGELGAEYETWDGGEPDYRNLTTDRAKFPKWSHWSNVAGIGAFPGGILHRNGIYHPTTQGEGRQANCGMADSDLEFCVVCRERIVQRLYETVDLIDSYEPQESRYTSTGWSNKITQPGQVIRVTTCGPVSRDASGNLTSSLGAAWFLNKQLMGGPREVRETGPVFTFTLPTSETKGELVVIFKDTTSWVRATPGATEDTDQFDNNQDPLYRGTRVPGGRRDHAYLQPVRLMWKIDIRADAAGLPELRERATTR